MNSPAWRVFKREDGWFWWNEDTGLPVGPYACREGAEEKCDLYYLHFRDLDKRCSHP